MGRKRLSNLKISKLSKDKQSLSCILISEMLKMNMNHLKILTCKMLKFDEFEKELWRNSWINFKSFTRNVLKWSFIGFLIILPTHLYLFLCAMNKVFVGLWLSGSCYFSHCVASVWGVTFITLLIKCGNIAKKLI